MALSAMGRKLTLASDEDRLSRSTLHEVLDALTESLKLRVVRHEGCMNSLLLFELVGDFHIDLQITSGVSGSYLNPHNKGVTFPWLIAPSPAQRGVTSNGVGAQGLAEHLNVLPLNPEARATPELIGANLHVQPAEVVIRGELISEG